MSELYREDMRRLAMYLHMDMHKELKKMATEKGLTIADYVRLAIHERMIKDKDLGF